MIKKHNLYTAPGLVLKPKYINITWYDDDPAPSKEDGKK